MESKKEYESLILSVYNLPIGDIIRTSTGKDGNSDWDWDDEYAQPIF